MVKRLLMVQPSFSLLYLFNRAGRVTRHCFAVSRPVVTGFITLSFLSHFWFLLAFFLVISLSLLTFDFNREVFRIETLSSQHFPAVP